MITSLCTRIRVKVDSIPSLTTKKCVNSVQKNVNTLYIYIF